MAKGAVGTGSPAGQAVGRTGSSNSGTTVPTGIIVEDEDQRSIVAAFQKWDLQRNGYISEKELRTVLKTLGIEAAEVHQMFRDVDRNRDGKIDYQEFVRWLYGSAPVAVRQTALAPTYQFRIQDIALEVEDDPSFAGWWSDASSIRPFIRWRDLFTERVVCESPEGHGLNSRMALTSLTSPLVFDIVDDGHQAVGLEVCLRSMFGSKVLGSGKLALAAATTAVAQGLGSTDKIVVEIFGERPDPGQPPAPAGTASKDTGNTAVVVATQVDSSNAAVASNAAVVSAAADSNAAAAAAPAKPQSRKKKKALKLIARVRLTVTEEPYDTKIWAKRKVECWANEGLPPLCGMEDVRKVLESLVHCPNQSLEFSLTQAIEVMSLHSVKDYNSRRPEDAKATLEKLALWLTTLEDVAKRSEEVYRRTAARLAETGDKVASTVLAASLMGSPPNHQLMRHALQFATKVDPSIPQMQQVEHQFKTILKFPDQMKLSELLMASEVDMEPHDPEQMGLKMTIGDALPHVDELKRYGVRDATAKRVLALLGCPVSAKSAAGEGSNYERLAMEAISKKDFELPPAAARLMSKATAFPGEPPATKRSLSVAVASRLRDWEALIGRFDVAAMPCRAEYDVGFDPLSKEHMPFGFFGEDSGEPVGGKGWFWVLHTAAINIGENTHAEDFKEYSVPADIGYRGRMGQGRWLDEDRYVADMWSLWRRALQTAAHLGIQDLIAFPFGMGAFLRNLHQLDNRYADPAAMRRLKLRVAQGLFEAATEVCLQSKPPMRLHVCLVVAGLESRMNHNVFLEAASSKVKEVPDLGPWLQFHRNRDALELAHRLSSEGPADSNVVDQEVRKVALLNGANNRLLGNHWFSNGARNAIDENLHRRSGSMCLGSLLVNLSTTPVKRSFQELSSNVELCGGSTVALEPYPVLVKKVNTPSRILAQVEVVPYSVLGTQLTKSRSMKQKAPEPDAETVFVDPAGLPFIQSSPGGAGGASGQIYKFLGISNDTSFPSEVQLAITEPLQAKFHAYGDKLVIHVVGPNFQGRTDCTVDEALDELSQAYAAALGEFAASGARRLRLLPISSSIFAGHFQRDMPVLTAQALRQGFALLAPAQQDQVLAAARLEMCIFSEGELRAFEEAFRAA